VRVELLEHLQQGTRVVVRQVHDERRLVGTRRRRDCPRVTDDHEPGHRGRVVAHLGRERMQAVVLDGRRRDQRGVETELPARLRQQGGRRGVRRRRHVHDPWQVRGEPPTALRPRMGVRRDAPDVGQRHTRP